MADPRYGVSPQEQQALMAHALRRRSPGDAFADVTPATPFSGPTDEDVRLRAFGERAARTGEAKILGAMEGARQNFGTVLPTGTGFLAGAPGLEDAQPESEFRQSSQLLQDRLQKLRAAGIGMASNELHDGK